MVKIKRIEEVAYLFLFLSVFSKVTAWVDLLVADPKDFGALSNYSMVGI